MDNLFFKQANEKNSLNDGKQGKFCDKIADYALKIVEETENALGPKSGWSQALQNTNSWLSYTMEISTQSNRK